MEYVFIFGIMFIVIGIISWRWVVGIDYMKNNHPNYKGVSFTHYMKMGIILRH